MNMPLHPRARQAPAFLWVALAASSSLLLAGCAKPSDFNEANITKAINVWLEENMQLCQSFAPVSEIGLNELRQNISDQEWQGLQKATDEGGMAVQSMADSAWASDEDKQSELDFLNALSQAGFVQNGNIYSYREGGIIPATYRVAFLLPSIKPHLRERPKDQYTGKQRAPLICIGHASVDKITRWSVPAQGQNRSTAYFTIKFAIDPAFAQSTLLNKMVTDEVEKRKGSGPEELALVLTAMNNGLRADKPDEGAALQ